MIVFWGGKKRLNHVKILQNMDTLFLQGQKSGRQQMSKVQTPI
jgi:hypothetical protein